MRCAESEFSVTSELCSNPARAHQTPPAHCLKDREQPESHQRKAHPKIEICHYDSGNKTKPPKNPAHQSAAKLKVSTKETAHTKPLPQSTCQANSSKKKILPTKSFFCALCCNSVNLFDAHFLFTASRWSIRRTPALPMRWMFAPTESRAFGELLNRLIVGAYPKVSVKHLDAYLDELEASVQQQRAGKCGYVDISRTQNADDHFTLPGLIPGCCVIGANPLAKSCTVTRGFSSG